MDLFKSAFDNDIAFIQTNLDFVGTLDPRGKSLLHYAVLGSAIDVIDFLLNQEINVNIVDHSGETAIFDAARKAKLTIAKKLITKFAKLNYKNLRDETVLHLACHKGNIDMVKLLIENGANLNVKTKESKLPIHYAILAGHTNLVNYLMETSKLSWFEYDSSNNSFLHYAAKTTNLSMIDLFIKHDLDPNLLNDHFETPLFNAVNFGTKETVIALLKAGSFIGIFNRRFETPLNQAKFNDHKDMIELLEEWKLMPDYQKHCNEHGLTLMVLNRDYQGLKDLLEKGLRLKKDRLNKTALDYANKYKLTTSINLIQTFHLS